MGQVQLVGTLDRDGGAEHATSILQHEVDLLGRNLLGRYNEVAFIFAVLVVDNNDKLAVFNIFYSIFNATQCCFIHVFSLLLLFCCYVVWIWSMRVMIFSLVC